MIRINNTNWEDLTISDIKMFLEHVDAESIFFDYKGDAVGNNKITKEVCAFANTYGGYLLIGVKDDGTIEGCTTWTEERVHNVARDTISPTPIIDIKKFRTDKNYILVARVEEGEQPPYITNTGKIYERLSSGSYPVKDSMKLEALNRKKESHEAQVYKKIESLIPEVRYDAVSNLVGCIDVGGSLVTGSQLDFDKDFYSVDLKRIAGELAKTNNRFSISRIGHSIQITLGELSSNSSHKRLLEAGMNNYLVMHADGSFYYRLVLCSDIDTDKTDITSIYLIVKEFKKVYRSLIGDDIEQKFIYAEKYQKLQVFRQFVPYYGVDHFGDSDYFLNYHNNHIAKYGGNTIVAGVRYPFEGYVKVDKQSFDLLKIPFNMENLSEVLLRTDFLNLGYIDPFETISSQDNPDGSHDL